MASLSQSALEHRLAEAVGLASAIGLVATDARYFSVRQPKPATLFGSGQVDQIRKMMAENEATNSDFHFAASRSPGILIVPIQKHFDKHKDAKHETDIVLMPRASCA